MTGRGFILLYIAARLIEPVPFDTLLDLTLCDDAIDYFDFSECLADLVKTEHLSLDRHSGLYAITEKGRRNSEICETSLPYSVSLSLDDDMGNVMDLKLMVPREDMGKILAARFRKAPEKLYSEIIDLLLNRDEDDEDT